MTDHQPFHETVQLGRLPKRVDPRTFQLSKYVDRAVIERELSSPKVPPLALQHAAASLPMYANDVFGDCGPVAGAHYVNAVRGRVAQLESKRRPRVLPLKSVFAFYTAVTKTQGSKPPFSPPKTAGGQAQGDSGVVLLDLMNVWRKVGIDDHKISAYAEVDPKDETLYTWASCACGGLMQGWDLPAICQDGRSWNFAPPKRLEGAYKPGSWGGHATDELANDQNGNTISGTWGMPMEVSPSFRAAYLDEVYAPISPDWIEDNGQAPNGLAIGDLTSDLAALAKG